MNYIVLYPDDCNWNAWKDYCDICGVSYDATCIKIKFDLDDVEYETDDDCDDEEDDEDYDD